MEVSQTASISTTANVNSYPRSPKALKAHQNNLTHWPHILFRQQCSTSSRPVCRNVPTQKCGVVPRQVFPNTNTNTRTNTRCPKPQVQRQQCQNVPTKSCDVVGHEQFNNVPKQHCFNNPEEKCTSVPTALWHYGQYGTVRHSGTRKFQNPQFS